LSLLVSIITTLLTFFAGHIILLLNNMTTVSIFDSSLSQFVLGSSIMPVFYCLLTVAATFIFRSSGGGITFSLVIMLIPALINMFPDSIQKLLVPILPQSAIHSLAGTAQVGSFELLGITTSILLLFAWIIITSLIGVIQFERK